MAQESVATSPTAAIDNKDKSCQFWGTAGYLMCAKYQVQPIHHPELLANMKAAMINEAMQKNVSNSEQVALAPQQRHTLWLVSDHAEPYRPCASLTRSPRTRPTKTSCSAR